MITPRSSKRSERLRCILCYDSPHHLGPCEFIGREEFKRRIRGDEKEMS